MFSKINFLEIKNFHIVCFMNIKNIISKIFISSLSLLLIPVNSFVPQTAIAKSVHENGQEISTEKFCRVPAHIPKELQSAFYEATKNIPCELLQSLERVEIFEDETKTLPRAMANARILKVRKDALSEKEIVPVLIHELGHVVDLGGLTGTYIPQYNNVSEFKDGALEFYNDDPSLLFYQISWTPKSQKADSTRLDFVGGYAKYDMFEDFAESFLFYIEHGNYFKALALQNKKLRNKYVFFKYHIFNGKEFHTGSIPENLLIRNWDITRL